MEGNMSTTTTKMQFEDLTKQQRRALRLLMKKDREIAKKPDGARIPSPVAQALRRRGLAVTTGLDAKSGRRMLAATPKGVELVHEHLDGVNR